MNRILLLLLAFVFVGCQEFEGQMHVTKSFEAISKRGPFSRAKTVVVPADAYSIKVDADDSSASISLELNGEKEKIRMRIPKNRIPKEQGAFEVLSEESGQPFNVRGNLDTDYSRSQSYRGWESCSRTVPREVCGYDSGGRWYCTIEYVTVYGQQKVEYYNLTTHRQLDMRLSIPGDANEVVAALGGRNATVNKIYTYQGYCH